MGTRTRAVESGAKPNNVTLFIGPGAIVEQGDDVFCVKQFATLDSVLVRNLCTGLDETITLTSITKSSATSRIRLDLAAIDKDVWEDALEKYGYVDLFLRHPAEGRVEHANELAHRAKVAVATLYRWVRQFQQHGSVTSLMRLRRSDAGAGRLPARVEEKIKEVIVDYFLTGQKCMLSQAHEELKRRCNNEGLPRSQLLDLR